MAKPFDAGVRVLIEQYLPDWLAIAPRKAQGPVRVIDSDLSTISAEADKLLYIDDPQPWILHLEPQANWDGTLEKRLSWYNEIVSYKHDCLVHTVLVLLRREADSPRLTGEFLRQFEGDSAYRYFRYQVLRVWQMSANELADGSWGLFPLAPLCDDAKPQLPKLMERMAKRLNTEVANQQQLAMLWETTAILSEMRYEPELILPLMQKVMTMIRYEDLKSHDYLVGKGVRDTVIRQGIIKFGALAESDAEKIEAIKSLELLRRLSERILYVSNWQELLADEATPSSN
jgi:hypothetical protein